MRLPMLTSIIQVINNWGKSQKNADFRNKLEFWDILKQKYDWENDDLDVTKGKVDSERLSQHMHIPAEIPEVRMEAHVQPDIGAIQAPPAPTMSYLSAAARAIDGLAQSTEVSQTTGVGPPQNVVDLTDADEKDDKEEVIRKLPKVEDVPENEEDQDETQDTGYGREMRIKKKPVSYEPPMTGKLYKQGVNKLCYIWTQYTLDEVTPDEEYNMPYKVGVLNVNIDTPTQAPDEGWQDDDNLTKHLIGVILVQQYNLKKRLELFGERAEEATTKEVQEIHDFGTYIPQDAKILSREE